MTDVFISYSTKDQEAKNELVSIFQREGISYFLDEKSLEIGKDIDDSLEEALKNTRFTVFLVSENSLKSIWVSKETIYRLLNEQETGEVSILPVLLDDKAFDEEFVFEIHDIMTEELEKQKNLRQKAASREMDTSKYDERINRLEFVIPKLNTIFTKLTEGLSANFFEESRKAVDLKKLITTIKKQPSGDSTNTTTSETTEMVSTTEVVTNSAGNLDGFKQECVDLVDEGNYADVFAKIKTSSLKYNKPLFNRLQKQITFDVSMDLIDQLKVFIGSIQED